MSFRRGKIPAQLRLYYEAKMVFSREPGRWLTAEASLLILYWGLGLSSFPFTCHPFCLSLDLASNEDNNDFEASVS